MKKNLALSISMSLLIFLSSFVVSHTTNAYTLAAKKHATKNKKDQNDTVLGVFYYGGSMYSAMGDSEWGTITNVSPTTVYPPLEDEFELPEMDFDGGTYTCTFDGCTLTLPTVYFTPPGGGDSFVVTTSFHL